MAVIPGAYLWTRDSTRPHPDGRLLRTGVRFGSGWPLARRLGFALPDGWVACGWRFEVETTSPQQRSLIQQHFGARRFAYNWALATVKADLDARAADPSVPLLARTLPTLRKASNHAKVTVAPWWPSCSKEAYASGIADLTIALQNWSASTHCHRGGRKVGFPRFKARHRDRGRVRFSTGDVEWASAQKQHRRLARRASSRLTQRRGRARPQKTTERWRRPMTPEPNPILGRGTSHRGARKGATQMRAELVTVG
jgi:putative transposase